MKQLKKDYYALPEAAERCGYPIEDLLWLGEHRHILLSVEAHHWPIVWGDERDLPDDPLIEIKKPIKPPFDSYYSGHLNLFWYDIHKLRANGKLSLTEVYAEKDGRKFVETSKGEQLSFVVDSRNVISRSTTFLYLIKISY